MKSKLAMSIILSVLVVTPALVGASANFPPTLPDTTCASAVGVGRADIPHAYETGNGIITTTNDACPTHYSGELGFGIGGVWFFSDETSDASGDGVVACYGSTTPGDGPTTGHHGNHNTINVLDDVVGSPNFTVTRDHNRSSSDPFFPTPNGDNNGDFDCGDSLVEPCANPGDENIAPGCNPLDVSESAVFGTWTVPGGFTLGTWAGADGAIVIFIENSPSSPEGTSTPTTTGAAWTDNVAAPKSSCVFSPGLDSDGVFRSYTCTWYDRAAGCLYTYRSTNPNPHRPAPRDLVLSVVC